MHAIYSHSKNSFIKTISGKTIIFQAVPTTTIQQLKLQIQRKQSIPYSQQTLQTSCKTLSIPKATLSDYNMEKEATIHLSCRLYGGAYQMYGPRHTTQAPRNSALVCTKSHIALLERAIGRRLLPSMWSQMTQFET